MKPKYLRTVIVLALFVAACSTQPGAKQTATPNTASPVESPDWGQTHWGEDLEGAMSAFGAQARVYGDGESEDKSIFTGLTCRAGIAPYVHDGFEFSEVRLCFNKDGHLGSIDLVAKARDFDRLTDAQNKRFGRPVRHEKTGDLIEAFWWNDGAKSNTIQLIRTLDDSVLHFTPVRSFY